MTSSPPPRRPQVFQADDPDVEVSQKPDPSPEQAAQGGDAAAGTGRPRQENRAFGDVPGDEEAGLDDQGPQQPIPEAIVSAASRRWGWGSVLVSAILSLAFLAAGLWFTRFVSVALAREDWLGYLANGLAAIAALAAAVLALKELAGFWRLSRLTSLRRDAEAALRHDNPKAARSVTGRLKSLSGKGRDKRWDLERFREEERHQRTGRELLGLADRVLLAPADNEARTIVYESARRVAVVTAIVPIAFIVVLFVLFENLRMTRRLAGAYGGRPGFLGGLRLFWWIITHLAATGAIALTDDLFGQFLGQDVASRVSRRLGEGAFNGAMTARLGVAAIALTRPLPFIEAQPPRIRSILVKIFPEISATEVMSGMFRGRKRNDATAERGNLRS